MMGPTSAYATWRRLSGRPGGTRLSSAALRARVPYFASVLPHVARMEPGLPEVTVPKWFMVHNHLHTLHAIACCTAAEAAMGMLVEPTVPRSHRLEPKGSGKPEPVQYLKEATKSLRARARLDPPDFAQITDDIELVVPVRVTDRSGKEVVHADITPWSRLADSSGQVSPRLITGKPRPKRPESGLLERGRGLFRR